MRILLSSIYPYVFLLLFLTIPFDEYMRVLPNILLVILAASFPFVVDKSDFKKLKSLPILVLLAFLLFTFFISLVTGRFANDINVLGKIILAVALVFLYLPISGFKKIKKAIIFSSVAAISFSVLSLIINVYQGAEFEFMNSAYAIEAMLVDRIYLGLLCILSILSSYSLLKSQYHPANRYYVVAILLNVLFLLLIVSRIAIIALILLFILGIFYKKSKSVQILFVSGIVFLGIILTFIINKDFRKQIFYTPQDTESKGLVANTLELEPRTIIWNCAIELANSKNAILKGLGFKNTNKELINCYRESNFEEEKKQWLIQQKYNTHNQFLDVYLGAGSIAFLLFVGFWILVFIKNRKDFFSTALLCAFMLFLMVENLFHRQIGAYYVGFVLILLVISESKKKKDLKIEP